MYGVRMQRDVRALLSNPPTGYSIVENADTALILSVESATGITGCIKIEMPNHYPITPPTVTFINNIPFHPNIDRNGNICLDTLKSTGWRPTMDLIKICTAIRVLLDYPNVDDPLNVEAAELFCKDQHAYYARQKSPINAPPRPKSLSSDPGLRSRL